MQRLDGGRMVLMQGRDPNRRILPEQKILLSQLPMKLNGWKLEEKYIVQQGIPLTLKNGRVHDYRMLVQKDGQGEWQITGCVGRVGPRQSVTSNLHGEERRYRWKRLLAQRFKEARIKEIRQEAYSLGLAVARRLESKFGTLCELGLDLAVDPDGHVWSLEVNPKPSREVFRRIGESSAYRKAITRPLEYALWKLKQGSGPQQAEATSIKQ
ncbi:YheC/YheD family protein [Paenibacillus sp. P26]|nr:YheC/YheD family protein [Paenibacillus sp. P26]